MRHGRSRRKAGISVFISFHDSFSQAYFHLGVNEKLGLSGRPDRPIGCLGTSKVITREVYILIIDKYFR